MIQLDTIIAVKDVAASTVWYNTLFGFRNLHEGGNFAVLAYGENIVLCLHPWNDHEHPSLSHPSEHTGKGLLLYFRTANMKEIRAKAKDLQAKITEEMHFNTNSGQYEFSLRDPDGYFITVSEYHRYGS